MNRQDHLPGDPVQWVKNLEAIWQAKDAARAIEGYTDDAVMIYGAEQEQSGQPLRARAGLWFEYASDLQITKEYIAHTDDCIVTTWNSTYTHPETRKIMCERGIECFYFRDGKVFEQKVWQHSWPENEKPADTPISE